MFSFLKIDLSSKKRSSSNEDTAPETWSNRLRNWKNRCNFLESENEVLRNKLAAREAKIEALRSKLSAFLEQQDNTRKLLFPETNTQSLNPEELSEALSLTPENEAFWKAVNFLIEQRKEHYNVDLSGDASLTNTNQIIFKNGASHALRALYDDMRAIVNQSTQTSVFRDNGICEQNSTDLTLTSVNETP